MTGRPTIKDVAERAGVSIATVSRALSLTPRSRSNRSRGRPGREAADALLALPDPSTAIFAFNDDTAIGAIQAARARGLRVPEDLSVVSFDDVEHATIVTPALTTGRQPLAEMGRTAVSLLSRLMERHSLETLHVELATRLVVRDSTAPPKTS